MTHKLLDSEYFTFIVGSVVNESNRARVVEEFSESAVQKSYQIHVVEKFVRAYHGMEISHTWKLLEPEEARQLQTSIKTFRQDFANKLPRFAKLISIVTHQWQHIANVKTTEDFLRIRDRLEELLEEIEEDCKNMASV